MNALGSRLLIGTIEDALRSSDSCIGPQSALDPAGPQAEHIANLWWQFFYMSAVVYGIVMLVLVVAIVARHTRRENLVLSPSPSGERARGWIVGGALTLTSGVLFALLIGDHVTGRDLRALATPDALQIKIVARQWWWEIKYNDHEPSKIVTTANEIHLPLGRTVEFELQANDVIHSFWIPNLHGKRDMIPGHPTHIYVRADRAGEFWGQCAEFCGYQHAKMRFRVVVEPEDEFQQWLQKQRAPAAQPLAEAEQRGQRVFLGSTCIMCHAIEGTIAGGTAGPDLTHLGSRTTIAAGSLSNTPGNLGGWIIDPQSVKPGAHMPLNSLEPVELRALVDYLGSLK